MQPDEFIPSAKSSLKRVDQREGRTRKAWLIPLIALLILAGAIGGYFAWNSWHQAELAHQLVLQQQSESEAAAAAAAEAAYQTARSVVLVDTFYPGISVDGLNLDGLTLAEATAALTQQHQAITAAFNVTLSLSGQTLPIDANAAGLTFNTDQILETAFAIGRSSSLNEERSQILDRFDQIEALKTNPQELTTTLTYDKELVQQQITTFAAGLAVAAHPAQATGFDVSSHQFTASEKVDGLTVDGAAAAAQVISLLDAGQYGQTVEIPHETVDAGMSAAALVSNLGLVSEATTYAKAVNIPRDTNMTLIVRSLNGLVLQPGETFSFNGYIGQRTAAKGYQEAGGIKDGILIQELGGGICQPNTTLCQAVLKADLQIIERNPHSWPSAYTEVGLDATVSWNGPDFKFKNNTDYPVAIVCWYSKPNVTFQIYGRPLAAGVKITLKAEHNGYIPEEPPIETLNPALTPGARVTVREPHTGQRATAYKIYTQNGSVIKTEVAFTSYYRPIQGIYEIGPAVTETTPPETAPPTEATLPPDPAPPTEPVPTEPVPPIGA